MEVSVRDRIKEELNELKNKYQEIQKSIFGLQRDTEITGTNYRNLTAKYDKLNQLNETLLERYNKLLSGSDSESQKLNGQLSSTQMQLQHKEDDLKKLQLELEKKKND